MNIHYSDDNDDNDDYNDNDDDNVGQAGGDEAPCRGDRRPGEARQPGRQGEHRLRAAGQRRRAAAGVRVLVSQE